MGKDDGLSPLAKFMLWVGIIGLLGFAITAFVAAGG